MAIKKINIIILTIILISFLSGILLYNQMPEIMASHWNAKGDVDGYLPKFWGLFLMPIISAVLFALFIIIPKIDPLRKNIKKFKEYFDMFILVIIAFLFYIYLLTIVWNLGYRFSMTQMIIPAIAILFYFIGVLNSKAKRNWFIGIRTPWTLSSDYVWKKTHKIGSTLFKLCALISLTGLIIEDFAVWFIIVPAIAIVLFLIIYSYFLFQKKGKKK